MTHTSHDGFANNESYITQELSEAELWALDDKQREEHFRLDERRRRAQVERAKRTVERVKLLPAAAGAPATASAPSTAMATATAVAPTTPGSPSTKEKGTVATAAAAAAAGGVAGKDAEGTPDG